MKTRDYTKEYKLRVSVNELEAHVEQRDGPDRVTRVRLSVGVDPSITVNEIPAKLLRTYCGALRG